MKRYLSIAFIFFSMIFFACNGIKESNKTFFADSSRVNNDLQIITKTPLSRTYLNINTLNFVADYIFHELAKTCDTVYYQTYMVDGNEYKNVIGVLGINKKERLVIGAHYDVCGNQQGADDNASGVAGLLELSRLLSKVELKNQVDFVAFTLEEPPFFKTEQMGSYIHAKSLYDAGIKIKGMVCLEMIGYFNDKPNSQEFPLGFLKYFYGNKGDFITVVQKLGNGKFGRKFDKLMTNQKLIKTKSFRSPASLPGVDFSDHLNYWKFGYSAVMITNTAFYRNKNYHEATDKMETLDLKRMCLVIDEVFESVKQID